MPIAHRTSVFELTPAEWADTQDLLLQARMALHDLLAPDGYLLGWNQGGVLHPHMHVIPRFDDEPLSDRWLRSAITSRKTDGPIHGRPGADGHFGVPGERGPGPHFQCPAGLVPLPDHKTSDYLLPMTLVAVESGNTNGLMTTMPLAKRWWQSAAAIP